MLSVNYLFYGSQEYHTQQSVQLNRIFHESFLSFWAAWGNVCISDCQGEQQQPFWYSGPQTTPESPVLCHQCADKNKVGLNLGPDVALWTQSPRPPSILSQMQLYNPHQSYKSNKENFNTTEAVTVSFILFFFLSFFSLFCVKEVRWLQWTPLEVGVCCCQQAVDGWSHSAELIEQPVVPSISVASFVVVQCRVTGYSLHIDSALSCHVNTMCCALTRVDLFLFYYYVFFNPSCQSLRFMEWKELIWGTSIFTTVHS